MKKRKAKLPPSYDPHECVVLAVDCAEISGWSLWFCGELQGYGYTDMMAGIRNGFSACLDAVDLAKSKKCRSVLVFERPFRGTSQGQWIGAWKQRWVAAGGVRSRMLGVYPASWRARVLGRGWGSAKREAVRLKEQETAHGIAHMHGYNNVLKPGLEMARHGDVAPAICIGQWAVFAGEVAKLIASRKKTV